MSEEFNRGVRLFFTDFRFFLLCMAIVLIVGSCVATPVMVMRQQWQCEDAGGTWKQTGGLNGLCIDEEGRIIP